jgi:nucleoside 2-deoxyribosyltransferase
MSKIIYLAGPIGGLTYQDAALGWRMVATLNLEEKGYTVLSPLREQEFLADKGVLGNHGYEEQENTKAENILVRDHKDVTDADVILMNLLPGKTASLGTMVELGWASEMGNKRIIIIRADGGMYDHLFVNGLGAIYTTLEEALETL